MTLVISCSPREGGGEQEGEGEGEGETTVGNRGGGAGTRSSLCCLRWAWADGWAGGCDGAGARLCVEGELCVCSLDCVCGPEGEETG